MKDMKHFRQTAAVLSALMLGCSNFPAGQTAAAAKTDAQKLPFWVPDSYDSAIEFCNTYGGTHIVKDYLCIVYREREADRYDPRSDEGTMKEVSRTVYAPKTEKESGDQYEVVVYHAEQAGSFEAGLIDTFAKGQQSSYFHEGHAVIIYSFEVDAFQRIKQTDIFGWVPDCVTEYEDYVGRNGAVSTKDGYILFALTQNQGTPYRWQESVVSYEGDKSPVEQQGVYSFTKATASLVDGGTTYKTAIYKGTNDGSVTIGWNLAQELSTEAPKETKKEAFQVLDNGATVLKQGQTRVTVLDEATGQPIQPNPALDYPFDIVTDVGYYQKDKDEWMYTGPVFVLDTNPGILSKQFTQFFDADKFNYSVHCSDPEYVISDTHGTVTKYDNKSYDITCKAAFTQTGDFNRDGTFDSADAKQLAGWLGGKENTEPGNWQIADYDRDYILTAKDLTIMKRELLKKQQIKSVRVEVLTDYGGYGVAGQDLGSGSFVSSYQMREGDTLSENSNGHVLLNHFGQRNDYTELMMQVLKIDGSGITVAVYDRDNQPEQMTLKYDNLCSPYYSRFIEFDGINYTYTMRFTLLRSASPNEPDTKIILD